MRSKFKWIYALLVALTMQFSFAQDKTVTGTVSDDLGVLPGVNVLVKGTTRRVTTDFDGKFSIKSKEGEVLVFSFVEKANSEKTVGAGNTINVSMTSNNILNEVVVGALGIKRKATEISYKAVIVSAKEINQTSPINAVTALAGKVSGLTIATRDNGINPATGILLRGYKSLSGNNQALIVIDGVIQASSALNNLNPNDILNINVLKSSNATVLYGAEGANGVLIVTTKQGSNKKIEVTVNSSMVLEQVKYFPELQTTFGPGFNNLYDPIENTNWGPRFDGLPRRLGPILADGSFQTVNYAAAKNGRKNFFVDGVTLTNSVSLSGGDAKSSFYFSAQRTDVTGITPGDEYRRDNFRLNASTKGERLSVSTAVSFFDDNTNVVGTGGYQNRDIFWNILNTTAVVNLNDYKDWRNDKFSTPDGYYNDYYQNPYMIVDIARNKTKSNRLFANVKLDYKINDYLSATYSLAGTFFTSNQKNTRDAITYNPIFSPRRSANNTPASVALQSNTSRRINSDFTVKFNKDLGKMFNVKAVVGTSAATIDNKRYTQAAQGLQIPGLYDISTRTGEISGVTTAVERRFYDLTVGGNRETVQHNFGVFGDVTLGFNKYLFLNGAYRADRISTLSKDYSNFYGAGLSFILTDAIPAIKGDILNFAKISGGFSLTGNSATPSVGWTNELFSTPAGFPYGSTAGFATPTFSVNPSLTPELIRNKEINTEFEFFKSRVKVGVSYYISNATNQFISSDVSYASGANVYRTNAGEIENKGLEIDLNFVPISTANFNWSFGGNITKIQNKVVSLTDGASRVSIGSLGQSDIGLFAEVGSSYPSVFGTAYVRDGEGRVVIDPTKGNPLQSSELKNLGSTTPNLIVGLNTSVRYKTITLSAVADYRTGHVYYNDLNDALEFTGSTAYSASAGRQPFVFPNSSYQSAPGVYTANTNIPTSAGGYDFFYGVYNNIKENYVVDASTFKLREVVLSYDIPQKYLTKTFIKGFTFGLVGRNILMLRSAANKITDPEFTNSSEQAGGFGTQKQLPPTSSYGFKLDLKF